MATLTMYTDGGARGNPGPAGAGAALFNEAGKEVATVSDYLGEATNNVAEYEALLRALMRAESLYGKRLQTMTIHVRMDSELIVRQMQGVYKVKEPKLKEFFSRIAEFRLERAPNITFEHIPREQNKRADALVNEAIDRAL
ncbi:MAG: ribonuclease HI family protein [Patescibacteria group bacterium]|nr:ribonuclease HI family protein [Patescibacteria group bacterium]